MTKKSLKRPRFNNMYDFDKTKKSNAETVDPVSQTVPDKNLSLKELVERYTRTGTLPAGVKESQTFYDADDPLPDFQSMSKQERAEFVKDMDALITEKRKQLIQKKQEMEAAKKEADRIQHEKENKYLKREDVKEEKNVTDTEGKKE